MLHVSAALPCVLMPESVPLLSSQQKTLAHSVSCQGAGVHGGQVVTLTIHPAAADHGVVFERLDKAGGCSKIAALWDNVQITPLRTQIINGAGVEACTIEHLMAAFYASGIDNALVCLSGAEVPIMDGGSAAFLRLLAKAGTVLLPEKRRFLKILQPVEVRQGSAFARFVPSPSPQFAIQVAYPDYGVAEQGYQFDFERDDFSEDVAAARTFGFQRDIDALRAKGLTLGGSLDNALLINAAGQPVNPGGYYFTNELARHKLLDAIGDIALGGAAIIGRFEGYLSGHALNNALLKALFAQPNAARIYQQDDAVPIQPPSQIPPLRAMR